VLDRDLVDRAMEGVDEVYHLAGLPGMWLPRKADFHTVNYWCTEIVIETARERGIKRSCTARRNPSVPCLAIDCSSRGRCVPPGQHAGPYTRSKMLADRFAMQAAASDIRWLGCPPCPSGL